MTTPQVMVIHQRDERGQKHLSQQGYRMVYVERGKGSRLGNPFKTTDV